MENFGKRIEETENIHNNDTNQEKESGHEVYSNEEELEAKRMEKFESHPPMYSLYDIILSEYTISEVERILKRIHHYKKLYVDWNLQSIDKPGNRISINLYGPPGTGKTMLAEAIASKLQKSIIEVNYAEIESRYVGETPKNIKAAFKKAIETDSILFFDEADSILGSRMTEVTQAADHGVNVSRAVMLRQLDLFSGIVIFATNLPGNYDQAFVRRITFNINLPLPDYNQRTKLWNKLIPEEVPGKNKLNLNKLADLSDGFSGGDIKNCVIISCSDAVGRYENNSELSDKDVIRAIENVKKSKDAIGKKTNDVSLRAIAKQSHK